MIIGEESEQNNFEYYISDDEVRELLRDADEHASPKWKLYIYLSLFLGRRSQVTLAINIRDFPGWRTGDFSRLQVKENKGGKKHVIPVPSFLEEMIIEYMYLFRNTLYGGYFFPSNHQSRWQRPYINSRAASSYFQKARKRIGGTFLEKYEGGVYRIHPHTLRHWYQTRIATFEQDPYFLQRLMGYQKMESVLHYVHKKDFNEKAPKIVSEAFSKIIQGQVPKEQKMLSEWRNC